MPIWEDLANFVWRSLIAEGKGFAQVYTTTGNGVDFKVAENQDRVFPAITIVNHGASQVLWGYQTARVPLEAGASRTIRWKNPVADKLVVNDQSNSGVVIEVSS